MEYEKIPTILTADEMLDRAFRKPALLKHEKRNKKRADEEFLRSASKSLSDKLIDTVKRFPTIENLPVFYQDMTDLLFGIDRMRRSLGALSWAAEQVMTLGNDYAWRIRRSEESNDIRKQGTARIASVIHQIDDDLHFLNDARNVLRKLPDIRDDFTIVVAGFPNVGKSSFIRLVSSAEPEVAEYAFTTKQIVVGHCTIGRERIQIVDTPGILDRPALERNYIEHQALSAITNIADVILFIIDASELCGYPIQEQLNLLEELRRMIDIVPIEVVVNKSDLKTLDGYQNMSTTTEEGIEEVVERLLTYRVSRPSSPLMHIEE
ncbi:MAG: GTPase [Methanogenium sp.]|jgi:nucleolar GTP-binding protein